MLTSKSRGLNKIQRPHVFAAACRKGKEVSTAKFGGSIPSPDIQNEPCLGCRLQTNTSTPWPPHPVADTLPSAQQCSGPPPREPTDTPPAPPAATSPPDPCSPPPARPAPARQPLACCTASLLCLSRWLDWQHKAWHTAHIRVLRNLETLSTIGGLRQSKPSLQTPEGITIAHSWL